MTLCRNEEMPHSFCPLVAQKHGLHAAVVHYAMRYAGWESIKGEPTPRRFNIKEIIETCSYISEEDVRNAAEILERAGLCGVIDD